MKVDKISIEPMGDKEWVKVLFDNGNYWIPKLEEIALIASKIGICEDRKYDWPKNTHIKGAEMVADYVKEAIISCYQEKDIKLLNDKFQIPQDFNDEEDKLY
jgi:hypothetical protein